MAPPKTPSPKKKKVKVLKDKLDKKDQTKRLTTLSQGIKNSAHFDIPWSSQGFHATSETGKIIQKRVEAAETQEAVAATAKGGLISEGILISIKAELAQVGTFFPSRKTTNPHFSH